MRNFRTLFLIAQAIPIVLSEEVLFNPKVTLDNGVFTGSLGILTHNFLGIPFAKPPFVLIIVISKVLTCFFSVGDLRFRLPQKIPSYVGQYDASKYGPACPQQAATIPIVPKFQKQVTDFLANTTYSKRLPDSEDCKSSWHAGQCIGSQSLFQALQSM